MPAGYDLVSTIKVDGSNPPSVNPHPILDWKQHGLIYLNAKSRILVVAYRGTDDLNDVVKDANIDSEPYLCVPNYGRVHEGFQNVYFSIRDSVIETCKNLNGSYNKIVLTGHSLGAAVSELSAPDLLYQHFDVPLEVINFAAPRVGKADFCSNFDRDISVCYRIVNRWDGVPRLPAMWNGYRHVGTAVNVNGGFTINALHSHSLDGSYRQAVQKLQDAS